VPRRAGRQLAFRAARAFEYLESDDFAGFLARDLGTRLAEAGLRVDGSLDAGSYRVFSCRAGQRARGALRRAGTAA
jgi:hypothetical protein